uniref:DUF5641 domain-containing protein n=1 Tax=Heterorhabditis bacteriophora TaxID=37862 RepID=A0A1I7WDC0_HETBA
MLHRTDIREQPLVDRIIRIGSSDRVGWPVH